MPITIYSVDGTGSPGASIPNGASNPAGGFPASVASNLVAAQPDIWQWYPVEYGPGFAIPQDFPIDGTSGFPNSGSARRAISMIASHLASQSTPNHFCLIGLSQGAWVSDTMYEMLRSGPLSAYYPYLLNVVTFGSPRRPYGHTLTSACLAASGLTTGNLVTPAGQGAAGTGSFPISDYGMTIPGVMQSPPTNGQVQWFCNINDAASDSSALLNGNVVAAFSAAAQLLWHGSLSTVTSLWSQLLTLATNLSAPERQSFQSALQQWFPFLGGGPSGNPHAQYNNPYSYTGVTGGSRLTAVDMATNFLKSVGTQYAATAPDEASSADPAWTALTGAVNPPGPRNLHP